MVTSVEQHATRAGVEILERGGNAADAAVATAYALAVTHPSAGNIGGGGFLLINRGGPNSVTQALDFRETAPLSVTRKQFGEMIGRKARGADAAGVPGSVAGLSELHAKHGHLPFADLLEPAIRLARDGFALGARQALVLRWAWPYLKRHQSFRRVYSGGGKPKPQGAKIRRPRLAATLARIQKQPDTFYRGELAQEIVQEVNKAGGLLSLKDFRQYKARWRTPLSVRYHDLAVDIMPPPSAGGVAVAQMLSMLQKLSAHKVEPHSAQGLHLFAEVAKRAHAERRLNVGDPDALGAEWLRENTERWQRGGEWLSRFPITNDVVTPSSSLHPLFKKAKAELDNTTHLAVADGNGMVISLTTTLSGSFGAKVMLPKTGVILGNTLAAFGTAGANTLRPGYRMTSSMSPTLVRDKSGVRLVLGSPGGDTIPNTVVQVLRLVVSHGYSLDAAIDAPRIHHGFVPDAIRTERLRPASKSVVRALQKMGHRFEAPRRSIGDANNLALSNGEIFGYSDPREGGLAAAPRAAASSSEKAGPAGSN